MCSCYLDMYSLLQLKTKYAQDTEEISLPEVNSEGNTTLNELEVIFLLTVPHILQDIH